MEYFLWGVDIQDAKVCLSKSGTTKGYSVEARYNYHVPKKIGGEIYNIRWRTVPYLNAPCGIPKPRNKSYARLAAGLLGRAEAEALRWWFICASDASERVGGTLCLETRIVEHKIKYEYSVTPVRYLDAS